MNLENEMLIKNILNLQNEMKKELKKFEKRKVISHIKEYRPNFNLENIYKSKDKLKLVLIASFLKNDIDNIIDNINDEIPRDIINNIPISKVNNTKYFDTSNKFNAKRCFEIKRLDEIYKNDYKKILKEIRRMTFNKDYLYDEKEEKIYFVSDKLKVETNLNWLEMMFVSLLLNKNETKNKNSSDNVLLLNLNRKINNENRLNEILKTTLSLNVKFNQCNKENTLANIINIINYSKNLYSYKNKRMEKYLLVINENNNYNIDFNVEYIYSSFLDLRDYEKSLFYLYENKDKQKEIITNLYNATNSYEKRFLIVYKNINEIVNSINFIENSINFEYLLKNNSLYYFNLSEKELENVLKSKTEEKSNFTKVKKISYK